MTAPVLALVASLAVLVGMLTVESREAARADRAQEATVVAAPEAVRPEGTSTPVAEPEDIEAGDVEAGDVETRNSEPRTTRKKVRNRPELPGGGHKVFGRNRFLVAYYGTASTGVLGVLGERRPDRMHRQLVRAAKPFKRKGEQVVPVYELIVTIADAHPGRDGDFNHDITRAEVRRYIRAAERNGALVVLDIQPGRDDFLSVAKRWRWALKHPQVGLALDPEWRMGPHEVPGRVIGSVRAREVNRVSAWLNRLTRRNGLPEKVFMLHQFRSSMIVNPQNIVDRRHLAEVLHVDGFGTPGQKLDTYGVLARPKQFAMGFKLFYDEDVSLMRPAAVRKIRPKVRFVSYQ